MSQQIQVEPDVELTKHNFVNGLKDEIYRVPFINDRHERVFATKTVMDGHTILVEMADGTVFRLSIMRSSLEHV